MKDDYEQQAMKRKASGVQAKPFFSPTSQLTRWDPLFMENLKNITQKIGDPYIFDNCYNQVAVLIYENGPSELFGF